MVNERVKRLAKIVLGKRLSNIALRLGSVLAERQGNRSYAQEGEDRVLSSLLFKVHGAHIRDGFYVDVGAHHPYRYSNTCLFYKQGWSGINIDATPGSMAAFKKERPRDINVESGIGRKPDTLKFYVFNEQALNTFDETLAKARSTDPWHINAILDVPVAPLSEILKKHVPAGKQIDFLTVDVEGFDLDVLQSNDWERYRPSVVIVETLGLSVDDLASDPVARYLRSLGYVVYSKTVNSTFFLDKAVATEIGAASHKVRNTLQ